MFERNNYRTSRPAASPTAADVNVALGYTLVNLCVICIGNTPLSRF